MSWSIESGYSHKCPYCGSTYYDSDGGCECDAKEDDDDLLAEHLQNTKDANIERDNAKY